MTESFEGGLFLGIIDNWDYLLLSEAFKAQLQVIMKEERNLTKLHFTQNKPRCFKNISMSFYPKKTCHSLKRILQKWTSTGQVDCRFWVSCDLLPVESHVNP